MTVFIPTARFFARVLPLFIVWIGYVQVAHAQLTDYNQIVQPTETKARTLPEYLVQLAWLNNPNGKAAELEVRNAQDDAKNVRKEWMRDVQATFNLNEANLRRKKADPRDTLGLTDNVFFPRYNVGINLNMYNILSQKNKNQISRRNVDIAQFSVQEKMLTVRAETLMRYEKFKLAKEIQKTRVQMEQEANSSFVLIQQLYKSDEKTYDDYNKASTALFQAKEARLKADTDVTLAKLMLEEIIGLHWEQVQHPEKVD